MSDHGLEQQLEEKITTRLNEHERQIREMRTVQLQGNDALNLQLSNYSTTNFSLLNNGVNSFILSLNNTDNKVLFGFPDMTIYEGTAIAGNRIGAGYARDANYLVHRSEHDYFLNNNANLYAVISVTNKTGATQTITFEGRWRFLVKPAA